MALPLKIKRIAVGKFKSNEKPKTTIVLGAGASRSVSYAHKGGPLSPLDFDFFDLLRRLNPGKGDAKAVESVLHQVSLLPHECARSMERAFYTLHLRARMHEKLTGKASRLTDARVLADFATCVQALLRKAHGRERCSNHTSVIETLHTSDTVISFNYDLVAERAIRDVAIARSVEFSSGFYGFGTTPHTADVPLILKLHGSSNWRLTQPKGQMEETIEVATKSWSDFDVSPGYKGHHGNGSSFPILLPFWDKRIERSPWLSIWKAAFERLGASQRMIVWGYSLPPTDIKAQQLFSLSLHSKAIDLCVIDPSLATRNRWRDLLPRARYWEYENIKEFLSQPPTWWSKNSVG